MASIFNCKPSEIVFTSGGSESDNLAIRGAAWLRRSRGEGSHLITTPVEHSAVGRTCIQLEHMMDFEQTVLPVDRYGAANVEDFANAIRPGDTTIASIIYANNEVGTINPLPKLAEIAHEHNVLLHTDAVQAAGQLTLDVETLGVDMVSISAHKFYGPKGVGALYVRDGIDLAPSQTGGSHEGSRRAGTHNTAFIVGMAKALQLAYEEQETHLVHYRSLRDRLLDGIVSQVPSAIVTGHPTQRMPSHASFIFPGIDSSQLLMHLDMKGVAASGGSACKTGNPEPSAVLLAMGFTPEEAIGSLRLTVGRNTSIEDIDYAIGAVVDSIEKLAVLNGVS
jgi:cysteine desulfurase